MGSVVRWWVPLLALMGLWSCKHWRWVHAGNGSSLSSLTTKVTDKIVIKNTLLWDLPGLLTNIFSWIAVKGWRPVLWLLPEIITVMAYEAWNLVSRNITVLNILSSWSATIPEKIFVLTLQSFLWVGVLNVQCFCFLPVLPGGQATPKLVLCRCSFAQGDHFFWSNYRRVRSSEM